MAHNRALTLIEILAVVVILALLAGTLLVSFSGTFGKAKHELAKSGIGVIAGKVELYRIERSAWPTTELGLELLADGQATPADPFYLSNDKILDPWGNAYVFIAPGPKGLPYEIVTYGADARPGGDGEDADISSANLREDRRSNR